MLMEVLMGRGSFKISHWTYQLPACTSLPYFFYKFPPIYMHIAQSDIIYKIMHKIYIVLCSHLYSI